MDSILSLHFSSLSGTKNCQSNNAKKSRQIIFLLKTAFFFQTGIRGKQVNIN